MRSSSPQRPRICSPWPILVVSVGLLAGCGGHGAETAQGAGAAAGAGPAGQRKDPPIPVAVATASTGAISSYYTTTATLEAEKEADILARVSGVVQKIMVEEGDVVAEGADLLDIDNGEYQYLVDQAAAARADLESHYERLNQMKERDLVSTEEYEKVVNDLAAAKAAEGLARLNLSYTRVTAPFAGRIVARRVNVGQTVNVGTSLFSLSDFTPLLARVHVPSKEFNKLRPDQPVDLVLESNGTRLHGHITLVSPIIDPSSGTIKVTVEINDYPAGVRPGDFAQVSIVTEQRKGTTLVPKIALINDRGEQVVYVSEADSTAERRVVTVGFQDDNNAEILAGVNVGEKVVVKGQRSLKHGSPIKIVGAEGATQTTEAKANGGGGS